METDKKSNGALIGLIIIIVILIVGGIYIWMTNQKATDQTGSQALTGQDSAALNSLDADVQNADTNAGVDANAVN